MDKFSVEEINLMCIFDTGNKDNLLSELRSAVSDIYDPDMREVFESTIAKLETLMDAEFADIGFYIADEYIDDEENL